MGELAFAIDTETTGLMENRTIKIDKQPEVFEFFGCLFDLDTGDIKSKHHFLMKPKNKLPAKVTEITGVMDEDLKDAPPFSAVAGEIKQLLETAPLVLAHNASYDMEVLEVEFERLGEKINWPQALCSVEATIHLRGFRLDLTGLHKLLFNEDFSGKHRGENDVMALVRIATELRKRGEI